MLHEWINGIGVVGLIIIVIWAVGSLLDVPKVRENWSKVAMPLAALFLLHLATYWIWTNFWSEWYALSGFYLLQFVAGVGLYIRSLDTKQAKVLGSIAAVIGLIGLSLNVYEAMKLANHWNPGATLSAMVTPTPPTPIAKKRIVVTAPVAPNWSRVIQASDLRSFEPSVGEIIAVRKSNGEVIHGLVHGGGVDIGNTETVEFQSEKATVATVLLEN